MRVAVPAETARGERRVAVTPETVGQLVAAGLDVLVQSGAGRHSYVSDDAYSDAGAHVTEGVDAGAVDVLLHVRPLHPRLPARLHAGAVTIGFSSPSTELPTVAALRDARVTSFAMELVPRISRAQAMDALTSQALVAGYRCALEAATRLPRFFPLFMTAAGTVPPARVLVLGAGVAGLQAIATAKRLGAKVFGYDVRPASGDEVRSMGATFVELGLETVEGSGGYAREMTQDRAERQRELLTPHVADADVVITTAAIPGRAAPLLVTRQMVAQMRAGSVVVDLAADSGGNMGGNVEGSVTGEDVLVPAGGGGDGGVTVVGMKDAASTMPVDASRLYAKNVATLLLLMTSDGEVRPDFDDEVVSGTCLTHDGAVVHGPTAELLANAESAGSEKPEASREPGPTAASPAGEDA